MYYYIYNRFQAIRKIAACHFKNLIIFHIVYQFEAHKMLLFIASSCIVMWWQLNHKISTIKLLKWVHIFRRPIPIIWHSIEYERFVIIILFWFYCKFFRQRKVFKIKFYCSIFPLATDFMPISISLTLY